ncbi:hypothetical protein FUA23_17580 [Neolewinella aurantiaca]|uniref:Uncharacterized protein n=1 Tax=Neolewinella aurantiaca TaxID=2602767 RepID=A0A5C7FQU1_9BACT|nr:hypothetical protein [Neolewinella aurantiaca]TXF87742.1 hypothetical protein FUA23_17580 [Neolewinella aurantiaca]
MHDIEPHFGWREKYRAENDNYSPFYGREYSEFGYTNKVYNYLLHPQWDEFGAETLYLKQLFTDYDEHYVIIEMIGEWNDAVHNDVMHLKREFTDQLIGNGIRYFIIIMEGVLNFHGGDTDYYEEWVEEITEDGGWIALLNSHDHVMDELTQTRLDNYLAYGEQFNNLAWRPQKPERIFEAVEGLMQTGTRRVY